jgi:hypothetical protein
VSRPTAALALALVAATLGIAACGGGDDDDGESTTTAPATTSPAPQEPEREGGTPPGGGQLPPGLAECFADKGYPLESPNEIHSAPPEVVQKCFSELHGGGGAP